MAARMTRAEIDHEFELYYAANYGDPCTGDLQKAVCRNVWIAAIEALKRWECQQLDIILAQANIR